MRRSGVLFLVLASLLAFARIATADFIYDLSGTYEGLTDADVLISRENYIFYVAKKALPKKTLQILPDKNGPFHIYVAASQIRVQRIKPKSKLMPFVDWYTANK
jgi:hypothetical protein